MPPWFLKSPVPPLLPIGCTKNHTPMISASPLPKFGPVPQAAVYFHYLQGSRPVQPRGPEIEANDLVQLRTFLTGKQCTTDALVSGYRNCTVSLPANFRRRHVAARADVQARV